MDTYQDSEPESLNFSLEITGENLEDLLAYDDLFLDYFNAFLSLQVFPQALAYNRLTGAFEEVDLQSDLASSIAGYVSPSVQYGATNAESEKMLEWAREERLPLFLRTQLFRELKMCKLMLRPLEERPSASRNSSRQLRGYSRQTESYVSSLSNSADNSAEDALDDEFGFQELRYSALYKYQRPGSQALSMPVFREVTDGYSYDACSETSSTNSVTPSRSGGTKPLRHTSTGVHSQREPVTGGNTGKRATRISSEVEVIPIGRHNGVRSQSSRRGKHPPYSSTEEAFLRGARALSAPINYDEFLKMPYMNDFEALFGEVEPEQTGQAYIEFEEDWADEERTETDVRNLEGRLKMSLQQMKEQVLGTLAGMEAFQDFLHGTAGLGLLNFWLDCEYYKDTMEDGEGVEEGEGTVEARNRLFRDIQDKYKLNLTQDAREQISKSASNVNLSHTIFLRTQYDVLRRLRAYWVPRFLIHYERMKPFRSSLDHHGLMWAMKKATPKNPVPFFPSISLVRSMPLRPDDVLSSSLTSTWENVNKCSASRDIMSAQCRRPSSIMRHNGSKDRFLQALSADRLAGGPFQRYLENSQDPLLLSNLLFWEDVTEYGATEDKSADRLLRLQHAWAIYNRFLSHDSPHNIGLSDATRNQLHQKLLEARDFVEASVYDTAKYAAVDRLEKAWIRFLKEDLKTFLDCRVRPEAGSPPSTADAIEITVTDTDVLIKRPRPWVRRVPGSTASERARRLQRALTLAEDIDSERRALNRKMRQERRKEMEKERRKAVKAAYARQKEAKLKGGSSKDSLSDLEDDQSESRVKEEGGEGDAENGERLDTLPSFADLHTNRQMMAMFRKYLQDNDGKELANYPHLYSELDAFFDLKDKEKLKKDTQAVHIYKTYIDPHSKKHAPLPEKLASRLTAEKDRPKTASFKEVHRHIQTKLDEIFKDFLVYQAEELGVDAKDLGGMSQSELALRMGTDSGSAGWKKKHKGKATGRAHATREDKIEFHRALMESAHGHLTLQMLYFYKYLVKHGAEDGMPLLDKDLFFYVEVQKFKDCSHAHTNEELLHAKVQSIVECFLESVTAPTLQVDITPETQAKTQKTTGRYLQGKDTGSGIFDEAQLQVFRELLPYWAGFMKTFALGEKTKAPKTRYQKLVAKRMESIENYKIPPATFNLPSIPEGAVPAFTITLSEGVKFKQADMLDDASMMTPVPDQRTNKLGVMPDKLRGSRKQLASASTLSSARTFLR